MKMNTYKYTVSFQDKAKPFTGTIRAPHYEHARVSVENFWGRMALLEKLEEVKVTPRRKPPNDVRPWGVNI